MLLMHFISQSAVLRGAKPTSFCCCARRLGAKGWGGLMSVPCRGVLGESPSEAGQGDSAEILSSKA